MLSHKLSVLFVQLRGTASDMAVAVRKWGIEVIVDVGGESPFDFTSGRGELLVVCSIHKCRLLVAAGEPTAASSCHDTERVNSTEALSPSRFVDHVFEFARLCVLRWASSQYGDRLTFLGHLRGDGCGCGSADSSLDGDAVAAAAALC